MNLRTARELGFSASRLLADTASANNCLLVVIFSLAGLDLSLLLLGTGWLSTAALGSALPL
jgi:hypothetical protein